MTKKTKQDDLSLWERVKRTVDPLDERLKNRAQTLAPKPAPARKLRRSVGADSRHTNIRGLKDTPARPETKPRPLPAKLDPKQVRRVNRGKDPIEARLDLHGYHAAAAHDVLSRFIKEGSARGLRWVLVVTGKGVQGQGVLRREVPLWLRSSELAPLVVGFEEAAPHKGGGGALYVRLRKKR